MRQSRILLIVNTIILSVFAVISFFPIYMVVINSLKSQDEIFNNVLSIPSKLHFENYTQAFSQVNFLKVTLNSVIVTVIGVTGIVFVAALAGYKLARTKGILRNIRFLMLISSIL